MHQPLIQLTPREPLPDIAANLQREISGDVRFDNLSRTIYATDASIYEMIPLGVVIPKNVDDVVATIKQCRNFGIPLVPRGAGTGLAGGALGNGVQLDLSPYMNRIIDIDPLSRTVTVEPGVVLDELNAALAPHNLHFAPDVATSSRATIGGMIANNSCGAHSVVFGRTGDHVVSLTVVLPSGTVATFDSDGESDSNASAANQEVNSINQALGDIRDACYNEIQLRFPKILRSNGGYGLDRLGPPGTAVDTNKLLCGSEGTLGIVVQAKLRLTPLPKERGILLLHFDDMLEALETTPAILKHNPAAIELIDELIVSAGRNNATISQQCEFISGNPKALLAIELYDDNATSLTARLGAITSDHDVMAKTYHAESLIQLDKQQSVWQLRKAGLGLLMSQPGDHQPIAFVEDSAVDPTKLRDYMESFRQLLTDEGVSAGYYAHASVGCIHVRPVLNLKNSGDIAKMKRIAEGVADLALRFGGTVTGEHGDGMARSCWLEKLYGPVIIEAFRKVKTLFDPNGLLNPNKIVDPFPMTEHLRFGSDYASPKIKTALNFDAHGGMAGLVEMCSGVGQCRQRFTSTMCPSYMATLDETHTTRARANALRAALSNRSLLNGLQDPHLAEVMDLCLSCKACKTQCPTGVDMAMLKAEYLHQRNLRQGSDVRSRFIADMPALAARASRFPRMANWLANTKWFRKTLESKYGFDARISLPNFAHQTFRKWWQQHNKKKKHEGPRGKVVYFVDTWTNYFSPQVGIAATTLLEAAGYDVVCPKTMCCGRPAISKGLLSEAAQLAEANIRSLMPYVQEGLTIVGTEPSCILSLADEYPQLVNTHLAARVANHSVMIETFLSSLLEKHPDALKFNSQASLRYHAHCHQKALVGTTAATHLLQTAFGNRASEINSGCCGMAGSFGHEQEHYETSKAVGDERLFPAIQQRGDAQIAVSGFSCKQQIQHHTDASPRHLVEHLAEALAGEN